MQYQLANICRVFEKLIPRIRENGSRKRTEKVRGGDVITGRRGWNMRTSRRRRRRRKEEDGRKAEDRREK